MNSEGGQSRHNGLPARQGLYDPWFEHEACGVGFVVNIKGRKSHAIIQQALQVLLNLDHRGACGCEANTGDGAGILIQPPHEFLKLVAKEGKVSLPSPGEYGVGMLFVPRDRAQRVECEKIFANTWLLCKGAVPNPEREPVPSNSPSGFRVLYHSTRYSIWTL